MTWVEAMAYSLEGNLIVRPHMVYSQRSGRGQGKNQARRDSFLSFLNSALLRYSGQNGKMFKV